MERGGGGEGESSLAAGKRMQQMSSVGHQENRQNLALSNSNV